MSYARFGRHDSSVYVYLDAAGYLCCRNCRLSGTSLQFFTTAATVAHLDQHRAAGHTVLGSTYDGLLGEADDNDRWMDDFAADGDMGDVEQGDP